MIRIAVVVIELFALGNATLVAFLLCAWMEDHTFAHAASEIDWWIEAGKRFIAVAGMSVVASIAVWAINKPLLRWAGFTNARLPGITAWIALLCLCLAGMTGAILLAYTKPYI